MSLRAKLVLLSLLTLLLPWAGWRYASEMESTLRRGQEQALLTTAEVLSRVVASEPELLYRTREARELFDPTHGDLFAPLLPMQPLVDGFADEWPAPARPVPGVQSSDQQSPSQPLIKLGVHDRSMHMYVEVAAPAVVYDLPHTDETGRGPGATRLIVLTRDEFEHERAWSISAVAPGPLLVHPCEIGAPWRPLTEDAPARLTGVWRETAHGYAIELKGPVNLFGAQLSVHALDPQNNVQSQTGLGWLHTGSELLRQRLEQYAPNDIRASVVDVNGWLLARAGSIRANTPQTSYPGLREDSEGFVRSVYRMLFARKQTPVQPYGLPYGMWGPPVDEARNGRTRAIWFEEAGGEPSIVRAAVPVRYGERNLGALVIEQPGEQLALVREVALTRLLNMTFVATVFTVLVTLVFAARLSHRIRRLSRAASTALTPEGRIEASIPGTSAADELGALARSYDMLLNRVKEYTNYLQTLGSKLSHELRTPLTIVSSSLENLASEAPLPQAAQDYVTRAREGAHRAHAILTAMSEATRVEQSIEHTERTKFDVSEVLRNIGEAYRASFHRHRVEVEVADPPCWALGSPELMAQMLDKLMDNAADFAPPGAPVTLSLECDARTYRISVRNEGPLLPPQINDRLFESLVSGRGSQAEKPHLGLGLYIVRLIADFHHGTVAAANLPDETGVIVTVELPR
ncbi:MAG TPA: ATP-binding protein [Steroidobacter sp.]|nr:ATP-binding protein [Steroidobacter sp.]